MVRRGVTWVARHGGMWVVRCSDTWMIRRGGMCWHVLGTQQLRRLTAEARQQDSLKTNKPTATTKHEENSDIVKENWGMGTTYVYH